jgi:hypothetical protein
VHAVTGDRFGGEWCRAPFRKSGLQYDCADKPKSDLYAALLPQLNSGRVVLPKNDRLINQLCGLERRVARSGRDSIDHGLGLHDDIANVVAGCASLLADTGNTRRDELIERAFVPRGIKPLFPQKESGNG